MAEHLDAWQAQRIAAGDFDPAARTCKGRA